jgi:hypothetical protein
MASLGKRQGPRNRDSPGIRQVLARAGELARLSSRQSRLSAFSPAHSKLERSLAAASGSGALVKAEMTANP